MRITDPVPINHYTNIEFPPELSALIASFNEDHICECGFIGEIEWFTDCNGECDKCFECRMPVVDGIKQTLADMWVDFIRPELQVHSKFCIQSSGEFSWCKWIVDEITEDEHECLLVSFVERFCIPHDYYFYDESSVPYSQVSQHSGKMYVDLY